VHTSSDDIKGIFREELGRVIYQFPKYDMKILLDGYNAKIGREDILKPTIGNESSYEISSDTGVRIVNFATSKDSVAIPHLDIHKYTWTSPKKKTHNQSVHVLIDRRRHLVYLTSDLSKGPIVILIFGSCKPHGETGRKQTSCKEYGYGDSISRS
jgi:hypothetical protein